VSTSSTLPPRLPSPFSPFSSSLPTFLASCECEWEWEWERARGQGVRARPGDRWRVFIPLPAGAVSTSSTLPPRLPSPFSPFLPRFRPSSLPASGSASGSGYGRGGRSFVRDRVTGGECPSRRRQGPCRRRRHFLLASRLPSPLFYLASDLPRFLRARVRVRVRAGAGAGRSCATGRPVASAHPAAGRGRVDVVDTSSSPPVSLLPFFFLASDLPRFLRVRVRVRGARGGAKGGEGKKKTPSPRRDSAFSSGLPIFGDQKSMPGAPWLWPPPAAFSSFGSSATMASVVSIRPATDAAF